MASTLHCHSTFSKLDAFGLPSQMIKRAQELGLKALAITDHGNTSAHPKLEQACKESGVKPIYGVELYLNTKQQHKNHITILAKTTEGYRNLLKLSSLAYDKDHFYYLPCVDLEDLYENNKGLIVLSGCLSGVASELIMDDKLEEAKAVLAEMDGIFDDFYVEVQPLDLEQSRKINPHLIRFARELEIPIVATNDSHFIMPEHAELQHFLAMIRRAKNYNDFAGTMSKRCAIASPEQFYDWMSEYGQDVAVEAVENQDKIADIVEDFQLPKAKPVQISDEPEEVRYERLLDICWEGWKLRGIDPNNQDYIDRIKYELELIKSKGYIDYFLVVSDMIIWAKENNILVGPARGSAGGSLVSYLMRITEIDPIKFGLLFERFLDPSRTDPPDMLQCPAA
jgi:DNA polymerase-3 subunit alpha